MPYLCSAIDKNSYENKDMRVKSEETRVKMLTERIFGKQKYKDPTAIFNHSARNVGRRYTLTLKVRKGYVLGDHDLFVSTTSGVVRPLPAPAILGLFASSFPVVNRSSASLIPFRT